MNIHHRRSIKCTRHVIIGDAKHALCALILSATAQYQRHQNIEPILRHIPRINQLVLFSLLLQGRQAERSSEFHPQWLIDMIPHEFYGGIDGMSRELFEGFGEFAEYVLKSDGVSVFDGYLEFFGRESFGCFGVDFFANGVFVVVFWWRARPSPLPLVAQPGDVDGDGFKVLEWIGNADAHVSIEFLSVEAGDEVISFSCEECVEGGGEGVAYFLEAEDGGWRGLGFFRFVIGRFFFSLFFPIVCVCFVLLSFAGINLPDVITAPFSINFLAAIAKSPFHLIFQLLQNQRQSILKVQMLWVGMCKVIGPG
mmetsp:Transcript_25079/g.53239  ORF Transcript_25079/g.53239 Transcript_25079/m.53239 type:complete len:310 (+) Transcript_25079:730-1659(+)